MIWSNDGSGSTDTPAHQMISTSRPTKTRPRRTLTFLFAFTVVLLDQAIKLVIDRSLPPNGLSLAPFFDFQRIHNPGINFGFLADRPGIVMGITLSIGIGCVGYVLLQPPAHWWTVAGFSLLLGGGFGNLVDRLRAGAVFDYLNITPFVGYLNLADLAIGSGVLLLVLEELLRRNHSDP
jgi:signal peptidase II